MSKRKQQPGPQRHAEGQHGEKTHKRFIDMLQGSSAAESAEVSRDTEGQRRLHEDREQHDEAEKNSEKVEAMRELQRGHDDDAVRAHARIPHEGDST